MARGHRYRLTGCAAKEEIETETTSRANMTTISLPAKDNGGHRRYRIVTGRRGSGVAEAARHRRTGSATAAAMVVLAAGSIAILLAGCATNGALAQARDAMRAGQFADAHREYVAAQSATPPLSRRQQREVADGLCITEYKLGPAAYPLAHQRAVCSAAASIPGSDSGPILAKVEAEERAQLTERINQAIAADDIATAESAIQRYHAIPDGDSAAVAGWSHQLWALIDAQDNASAPDRHAGAAIAAAGRQYGRVRAMDRDAFKRWVMSHTSADGAPLVSSVELGKQRMTLWVADERLNAVALNLDRFARINDALVARCRCAGRTNIGVTDTGLPAYQLRLDPETRRSEVLVLRQP